MDVRKYFEKRLNGYGFSLEEYKADNYEFWKANQQLVDEIVWKVKGVPSLIIGFGSGEGFYEYRFGKLFHVGVELYDKRYYDKVNLLDVFSFRIPKNSLVVMANFVHVLKEPVELLERLPKGVQVVIIDTFMAKPNTEWQLFFDNYMWEINKTELPRMHQYEALPGWKLIAQYQNRRYLELGYVILEKIL